MVARELLVDIDEKNRRLAYAIGQGRAAHYDASVQVFTEDGAHGRLVWIVDLLPNDLGPTHRFDDGTGRGCDETNAGIPHKSPLVGIFGATKTWSVFIDQSRDFNLLWELCGKP